MDCVLKFGEGGYLVEDKDARSHRRFRSYQVFDFNLLDEDESGEDSDPPTRGYSSFPNQLGMGV